MLAPPGKMFVLLMWYFRELFTCVSLSCLQSPLIRQPGLYGTAYLTTTVRNEMQCYKLCQYSKLCTSYNYITTIPQCQLLSYNSHVQSIYIPHPAGHHVEVTSPDCTPYQDSNPCDTVPCAVDEICTLIASSDSHLCLKKDIPCGDLSLPDEMNMTSLPNPALYNSKAEYECRLGYRFVNGSGKSTCQADGVWTDIDLVCELIRCEVPENDTGIRGVSIEAFNTTDIRYLTQAPYKCDTNFEQTSGSGFSVCQLNSTWSPIDIVCEVVGCGPPPRPNNTILDPDVEESFIGTTISYSCNETRSLYISGNTNTTCLENRRWDKLDIECSTVCFDFEDVKNGLPSSFSYPSHVGCQVEYVCLSGHIQVTGENISTCQDNGEWSTSGFACVRGCEDPPQEYPSIPNTVLVSHAEQDYIIGTVIEYECRTAALLTLTSITVTCTENGWVNSVTLVCALL